MAEAPATITAWTAINTDMQLPWTAFELAKNQALAQSAAPSVVSDQEGYVHSVGAAETAYAVSDSAAYLTEAQGIDAAVKTEADAEAAADTTAATTQAGDEAAFETADALAGQAYRDGMDQAAHNELVTVAQANHDLAVGAISQAQYDAAVAIAGATQTVTNQTVTTTFGTAEAAASTTQMVADAGAVLADQTTVANAVLQLATSNQQLITTYSLAESAAFDTERKADATALFNQELTDVVKTDDALMDAGNSPWGVRLAAQAQADLARQQGPTTDGAQGALAAQETATDAEIDAELAQEDQQAALEATFADSEAQQIHDRDVADAQIDDTSVVQQAAAITNAAAADAYFAAAPDLPSAPGGYSPITATGDYGHAHNIGGYTIGNATADWKGIVDAMFTATPDALPSVETSPNVLNAPGWAGPVGSIGSWNLPSSVSTGTSSGNSSGTNSGPSSAPTAWLQADGADCGPADWAKQVSAFQAGPQPEGDPPSGKTSTPPGSAVLPNGSTTYSTAEASEADLLTNTARGKSSAGATPSPQTQELRDDALAGQTEAQSSAGIPTMLLNADGSVRTVAQMNALVYRQLGSPVLIAGSHDQLNAAERGIPSTADVVSEEIQPYLDTRRDLLPGVVIFVLLTDGSGAATRHGVSGSDPVTVADGAGRAYVLRNRGLGYSVEGDVTRLVTHAIAADTKIFAPEEVQAWQGWMLFIDTSTAVTPLVSDGRDAYEVKTGRDMVSDEELHWFGGRGVTLVSMVIPVVAGAWFRRGANAVEHLDDVPTALTPDEPIIGLYGELIKIKDGLQAHHLNQYAAYKDIIALDDGISVKLFGDAKWGVGTPHYNAHESLEAFWDRFRIRRSGSDFIGNPTHLEYNRAMLDSLMAAGASREQAMRLIRHAIRERVEYGILGGIQFERLRAFFPRRLDSLMRSRYGNRVRCRRFASSW